MPSRDIHHFPCAGWVGGKQVDCRFNTDKCVAQLLCAALQSLFHVTGKHTAAEWKDLTEVQWMQPGRPPHHCMLICQLVRQSIEIWWPQDEAYYQGTVTKYLPDKVTPDTPARPCIYTPLLCTLSLQ